MAYEQVVGALQWAQAAGADLTGKLHRLVKLDANGNVVLAAAATDNIIGVLREENTSGRAATVQFGGIAKVVSGGTVLPGALITSDANGAGIATTTGGNRVLGVALTAADAGDIFPVMLTGAIV